MLIIKVFGKERPKLPKTTHKKKIDIAKYIKDYENGLLSVEEIAKKENTSKVTINIRINKYYEEIGKSRKKISKEKIIDMEKYIKDYEAGLLSVKEIAKRENTTTVTINVKMNEYYRKNGKRRPVLKRKREIDIEKYIKDYEEGKITIEKMAKLEGISRNTMNKILCEYYIECGREKPKLNQRMDIKIEKYIEDYENRRITVSEIAEKENASISTISSKIKKYYNLRREQKLKTVKKSKSDLIEKYIEDLENGKITPKELAEKLLVSQSSINMLIREFYKSKNRTEPKYRRFTK